MNDPFTGVPKKLRGFLQYSYEHRLYFIITLLEVLMKCDTNKNVRDNFSALFFLIIEGIICSEKNKENKFPIIAINISKNII